MNLARGFHTEGHCVAIVTMEAERAHCTIDEHTTATNTVSVLGALVTPDLRLALHKVDCCELTILTIVLAGQAKNWLGSRMNALIYLTEVHAIFRLLVHWHVRNEVKVR